MKRSDMLEIMITEIELMRGVEEGFYVYPEDSQIADRILTIMEKAGIEPPSYNQNDGSGVYGILSYYVNEWEQE